MQAISTSAAVMGITASVINIPRLENRCGGGVAVIHKAGLTVRLVNSTNDKKFSQFEHLNCNISGKHQPSDFAQLINPLLPCS